MSGFPPFRTVVLAVYCTACKADMPYGQWPSHYRTKAHRVARAREAAA